MVTYKRKCFKLKSSLMLIPNSISKNAKMKCESFKLSSLTQYIIFLDEHLLMKRNVITWRGSKHKAFTFMQQLVKPCTICKTHFKNLTRSTHDYSCSLWFFVLFIVWSNNLYNLLSVYMQAYKSCGKHRLLVMEVITMSLKRLCQSINIFLLDHFHHQLHTKL
jgi:hypothetical protein